eukprot:COSAG06_NODE_684_length_13103_cov_126.556752_2_plen_233_part_00
MPIINSYPQDINIQDQDAWVGTDYNTRNTKQYTAQAVANYLNQKGKVSIAGQIAYKFVDTPFSGQGTMALSPNNGTSFSAITGFKIAKANLTGKPVVAYLQFLIGQEILIVDQNDPESFGHYTINTYTVDANNDQYYDIALSFLGGNGSISIDNFYDIINFTFGDNAGDKTFIFTQTAPSTEWTVQHDLEKFPSITVVDTGKTVVIGDYTYVDNNNVILSFSAAFAGKAYFN